MRVRIHPKHGVLIEEVDDQRIDLHFFNDGNVVVDTNGSDDTDDENEQPEPDPHLADLLSGRN